MLGRKNMRKKILALGLAVCTLFSFTACSDSEENTTTPASGNVTASGATLTDGGEINLVLQHVRSKFFTHLFDNQQAFFLTNKKFKQFVETQNEDTAYQWYHNKI